MDLLARKRWFFVPTFLNVDGQSRDEQNGNQFIDNCMLTDIGIIAAIALLVIWAIGTFFFDAPGWIHLFLTLGVSILIWRVVVRGDRAHPSPKK
jgi:Family of unknown function (DUF5670)